jgi:hypothetical protein
MIKDIIKLADHLDMIGEKEEASLLDEILPFIKNVEVDMTDSEIEDEMHKDDRDVNYMLASQLTSISEKTLIIKSMIKAGAIVDDWMETYIAQSDLMIDNIYDKMITQHHYGDSDEHNKACNCKGRCNCGK